MKSNMVVIFRADGSVDIGTGHIFRCLVLALELIRQGHQVCFLIKDLPGAPIHRLEQHNIPVIKIPVQDDFDAEQQFVMEYLKTRQADWVVVDHYQVKEDYYLQLKELGLKVLAIDDINHTRFPVDVLMNQNILASSYNYQCLDDTISLFGPRYALVRDVYRSKREEILIRNQLKNIFIFMGGGDPYNITLKILEDLNSAEGRYHLDIILGSACPHEASIQQYSSRSKHTMKIYKDIDHLADLMLNADIAIGAGGSTTWEMCVLFLPIVTVPFAPNQIDIGRGIMNKGAGIYIPDYVHEDGHIISQKLGQLSSIQLCQMSERAGNLCDGSGVFQIIKNMR
ncbi:MAG: UDP-2,4-diacetamido-2,4,6-trideoxy-beta-L-altropyranose hydrolase [Candidatus Omnitrophica bacterium]|nr:UDP-2,4-diacetamido-2,4,6-trideoxy-beta-L-altropyranose hydrolase [Candidatus Omnitrophota bacterium]